MSGRNHSITLLIGGDCGPVHGPRDGFPLERYTELIRPTLAAADLRFVNCMRTYSSRGTDHELAPQVKQSPEMARIFTECGFDAITLANNHVYDSGFDAMLDTRELFERQGIRCTGAGRDLQHAREPAILEKDGIRVGYIGYCSVGRPGGEAGPDKPGINRLGVRASYETRGPHAPVRILTEPEPRDLERLIDDVTALGKRVDVVVVALHCGVIRLPRIVPDYHVAAAHACIDAGADLIVSHSPHMPKGIEVYRGKVVFYSLGVFSMTKPFPSPLWSAPAWQHGSIRNQHDLDPQYPFMPYGRHCTRSLLAKAVVSGSGVERVSFLPMTFDTQYRSILPEPADPRFTELVDYMSWASDGFDHTFEVDGAEVVVSP